MSFSPEASPSLPREGEGSSDSSSFLNREERRDLLGELRQQRLITFLNGDDREGIKREGELASKDLVPIEEVGALIHSRLTLEGERVIQETTGIEDLSLLPPEDIISALRIGLQEQQEPISINNELRKGLARGPSSLIDETVIEQLRTTTARTTAGRVPLKAWLLNPLAGARILKAIAEEATAQAGIRKSISETTRWLAEVAGEDVKRDTLFNYVNDLEQALNPYIEPYCQEKNLPIPPKNTPERMALLLRINAEMRALQAQGGEIAKEGERLVKEQVRTQAETKRNQMIAKEEPAQLESKKEVNAIREKELLEQVTHWLTKVAGTPLAGVIGSFARICGMVAEAASNAVQKDLRVAPILAVVDGILLWQTARMLPQFYSTASTPLETLTVTGLGIVLVGLEVSVGAGIGHGVVKVLSKKEEPKEELPQEQKFSLIKS